jgi:hypothetical protein
MRGLIGREVMCKCVKDGLNYVARVLDVKEHEGGDAASTKVMIHYHGWNVQFDEWVSFDRIQLDCPPAPAAGTAHPGFRGPASNRPRVPPWHTLPAPSPSTPAAAPPRTAAPRPPPLADRAAAAPPAAATPRPRGADAGRGGGGGGGGGGGAVAALEKLARAVDLDSFLRGLWAITCYQCGGPGQIGGGERRQDELVACSCCVRTYHLECTGPGCSAAIHARRGRPQPPPGAPAGRGAEWACRLCLQGEALLRRGPLGAEEDVRRIARLAAALPERHVFSVAARSVQRRTLPSS